MSARSAPAGTWHAKRSQKRSGSHGRVAADDGGDDGHRSLWKGSISFGLVQIPVSLTTAERANELAFHQLDRHDRSPIGYERINKHTGRQVAWEDVVKGYEIAKGRFVIVTDEDFEKANVEATQTIDIQDFVDPSAIPPSYFVRPYHLIPEGKTPKAYAVLSGAMAKKNLVAIALVVIRTRQHLCAILPRDGALDLEILRFAHELREAPSHAGAVGKLTTAKEVRLAEQLIDGLVGPWDPTRYKDTYRDDLLAAIRQKAKTGVIEARRVPTGRQPAATDLLTLLQQSVKATGKKKQVSKREAPSAKRAGSKNRVA